MIYKNLSEGFQSMEGEMLQNLYFYFKRLHIFSTENSDGVPIPTIEDLESIREDISQMMMNRHNLFIAEDLYNENWL